MIKALFRTLIVMLLASSANAQFVQVTNFSGTAAYSGVNVTVTSGGSFLTGGGICFAPPTEYWCGASGPGWYKYTCSKPVYRIKVRTWGINGGALGAGEYVQMYVNGGLYALQPTDVTSYTECSPGGGPMYLWLGEWMGPVGATSNYNGGDFIITNCNGINDFEVWCNGSLSGVAYFAFIDPTKPTGCSNITANKPCAGDTLLMDMHGDSTGASYIWYGPGGFTSTLQNPFIYPATLADTGKYYCYKSIGTVIDTDSTTIVVYPKPTVFASNNSPLCAGLIDTLQLNAFPFALGDSFTWTGPNAFFDTLENPIRPGFSALDVGTYTVVVTTPNGCQDTAYTNVSIVAPPPAPTITGDTLYCQGTTFVPFVVTTPGITGSTLEWYTVGTGGSPTTTALKVNTGIIGTTTVWVAQRIGSCESNRASISVRVKPTPPAPGVSGTLEYCQFVGVYVPLKVGPAPPTDTISWYLYPTGGSPILFVEPIPDVKIAGVDNYWVSLRDSGCEGPRTPVSITIHPKPAPPVVGVQWYCQFKPADSLNIHPSGAGDLLNFFGYGMPTGGSTLDPTPPTVNPGVDTYYANETTKYGCVSDMAMDTVRTRAKPGAPVTRDTVYCQGTIAPPLSADSSIGSRLTWYLLGNPLLNAPIPSNSIPGDSTWWVKQTVWQCSGDSTPIKVTTIYKPVFTITASNPWVCQFDSLTFAYNGPTLNQAGYVWSLPMGASYTHLPGTVGAQISKVTDSMISVRFDSVVQKNTIYLHATDNNGFCYGDDSIRIKIVPKPSATSYSKADVCLGDTTTLMLGAKTPESSDFVWLVDNVPMASSTALNIIASSSNSGGPFSISWNDSGRHVIQLNTTTLEGCRSLPSYDSINVHTLPSASFKYTLSPGSLCIEDSVLFSANDSNYNYSYQWAPAHAFSNVNKPTAWGRVEQSKSVITLTVTDPFGCFATQTMELDPGSCCSVIFPNAFTPNGDHLNDFFRPIYTGYHKFHVFRVANRWGQTVFESTNSKMEWDGNFNGVPQDMGVYYYYIKFDCGGSTIEQTGDVTLVK